MGSSCIHKNRTKKSSTFRCYSVRINIETCVYGVDQSIVVGNDVTFMSQDDCVQ